MANNIVGVAVAGSNDHVYTWFDYGMVMSGTSSEFGIYRSSYICELPAQKSPNQIVGIGIARSNDYCYAWYKDGTVSCGTSSDLGKYKDPYKYSLPSGKSPNDIVGIGIAGSNDYCYAWYKDGTVSCGKTSDLAKHKSPYKYSLPSGKSPTDIFDIGISGSNDYCYAWYKDGTVSCGTTSDLEKYKKPYKYVIRSKMEKISNTEFYFPPQTTGTVWYGWNVKGKVFYVIKRGFYESNDASVEAWWIRIGYFPWQWGSIKKIGNLSSKGVLSIPAGVRSELRIKNNCNDNVQLYISDDVKLARLWGIDI